MSYIENPEDPSARENVAFRKGGKRGPYSDGSGNDPEASNRTEGSIPHHGGGDYRDREAQPGFVETPPETLARFTGGLDKPDGTVEPAPESIPKTSERTDPEKYEAIRMAIAGIYEGQDREVVAKWLSDSGYIKMVDGKILANSEDPLEIAFYKAYNGTEKKEDSKEPAPVEPKKEPRPHKEPTDKGGVTKAGEESPVPEGYFRVEAPGSEEPPIPNSEHKREKGDAGPEIEVSPEVDDVRRALDRVLKLENKINELADEDLTKTFEIIAKTEEYLGKKSWAINELFVNCSKSLDLLEDKISKRSIRGLLSPDYITSNYDLREVLSTIVEANETLLHFKVNFGAGSVERASRGSEELDTEETAKGDRSDSGVEIDADSAAKYTRIDDTKKAEDERNEGYGFGDIYLLPPESREIFYSEIDKIINAKDEDKKQLYLEYLDSGAFMPEVAESLKYFWFEGKKIHVNKMPEVQFDKFLSMLGRKILDSTAEIDRGKIRSEARGRSREAKKPIPTLEEVLKEAGIHVGAELRINGLDTPRKITEINLKDETIRYEPPISGGGNIISIDRLLEDPRYAWNNRIQRYLKAKRKGKKVA
ncbi:MAG: hypothetical protein PHW75_02680 [Patescibacteria group bacterium]|nr:hypothetical protein [Patescibacteria group bacterium]